MPVTRSSTSATSRAGRRLRRSAIVTVISAAALLGVPMASLAAAAPACGQVVTSDTTLTADLGPCAANGIVAGADGITIDLGGHRVFGTGGTNDGVGVKVEGHTNVTVTNGTVSDFDAGVLIRNGGHNLVNAITARDNVGSGGASPTPVGDGIAIEGSSDNNVLSNTAQRNGPFAGIGIYQNADADHPFTSAPTANNLVAHNRVFDNTACRSSGGTCDDVGIRIEPGVDAGNVVDDNDVRGNGADGISVFNGAHGVGVTNNRISLNGFAATVAGDGIRVFGYGNTINSNRSLNNKAGGISVGLRPALGPGDPAAPNGRDNTIVDNTATGNGTLDLWDSFASTPCDNNLWLRNHYQTASPACTTALGSQIQPPVGDFDNDGRTDVAYFRPSNGRWHIIDSRTGAKTTVRLGAAGDIPVAADYDGDGYTDPAVYRPSTGEWFVRRSTGGQTVTTLGGQSGDVPVPADYDGDGKADLAIFRPGPTAVWLLNRSTLGPTTVNFGTTGDIPVPADYGGSGRAAADVAVFRPSTGVWFVKGVTTVTWGVQGDIPVPGDYLGDGRTEIAVFRPSNATWYVLGASATQFGATGDIPEPGSYTSAKWSPATVRLENGTEVWYIQGKPKVSFGVTGDRPVPLPSAIRGVFFP